jgi:tRNA A37 threonylcarbamoyltransferase TsaD
MEEEQATAKELSMLYEGLVETVNHSEAGHNATLAVMSKVLVLLALSGGETKESFFERLDYVWEFENFFQPDSNEKH